MNSVELLRVYPLNQPAAGQKAHLKGRNGAEKARGEDGNIYVFKSPQYGRKGNPLTSSEVNEAIAKEVVASHILIDGFKLQGVPYQEGLVQKKEGHLEKAVICPYIPELSTLCETSINKIKNPDEAVAQSIVKGWIGEWGTILNNSNVFVKKDGTVLAGDFGEAFRKGISFRPIPVALFKGFPKANFTIMNHYANSSNVKDVSKKIKKLSDDEIRGMVHQYGTQYTSFWNQKLEDRLTQVLIQNRDELKKKNIFENFYKGFHPLITPPFSSLIGFVSLYVRTPLAHAARVLENYLPKGALR